jgi:hypothetical protein
MPRFTALAAAFLVAMTLGASAPAKEEPLYGIADDFGRLVVAELDPTSLRVLPGRRAVVGAAGPSAWSFDPARTRLAVAIGQRLRIVDLRRLRVTHSAKLGSTTTQLGVVWTDPARVVVLQRVGGDLRLAVVDARRPRVLSRARLGTGTVVDAEATQSGVALLVAPSYEIGPARLLLIDGRGNTREVGLRAVRAGTTVRDGAEPVVEEWKPALAVDRGGGIAYVVSPSGPIAAVTLATATATYHAPRGSYAKVLAGASRDAFVLDGRIVVTGQSMESETAPDGTFGATSKPFGLEVIDPSGWSITRLVSTVSDAQPWRGAVVTAGGTWSSTTGNSGAGVAVYALDGKLLTHALPGRRMWITTVHQDRAYGFVDGWEGPTVVDLVTGAVERRTRALPWLLVDQSSFAG